MARWVRCPISSANAQDDRTNHSLLRNSGGAHQHVEPRWITQPGADVLGMVVGRSCMLGLGQMGQKRRASCMTSGLLGKM